MASQKLTALVTGASAGLGAEFCRQLAARCDLIIAVARRAEPLQALARELEGTVKLHSVAADLADTEGVHRTLEALRQQGPVDLLVNNAGFSSFGHFDALPIDSQRGMVDLHIQATITLCRAAIPFMRERGGGSIVNVSSLGALFPASNFAVYAGTKAFLNAFSEALQEELAGTGIHVQALCPGFTRTEFHDAMAGQGFQRERIDAELWMDPPAVVRESLEALGSGRVLVVPGAGNRAIARAAVEKLSASLQ